MAGALSCICAAFSASVMRATMSFARASGVSEVSRQATGASAQTGRAVVIASAASKVVWRIVMWSPVLLWSLQQPFQHQDEHQPETAGQRLHQRP